MNRERAVDTGRPWTPADELAFTRLSADFHAMAGRRSRACADMAAPGTGFATADALYRARRRRARFFPDAATIFGEPAWDILLDLYSARERRCSVSVSSACLGACAPETTALRWLGVLEDRGLLQRSAHPSDRRARLITLSPPAVAQMASYLAHLAG